MSNLESQTLEAQTQEATTGFDNQLGPGILGKGSIIITLEGRTVVFGYKPQDERRARVLYAFDDDEPDTPMPANQVFPLSDHRNVNITYDVAAGSDIQLSWAFSPTGGAPQR